MNAQIRHPWLVIKLEPRYTLPCDQDQHKGNPLERVTEWEQCDKLSSPGITGWPTVVVLKHNI